MANSFKVVIFLFIIFFFVNVSFCYADDKVKTPEIKGITPDPVLAGTVITITGNNFNKDNAEVKINYVSIHSECKINNAEIKGAQNEEIKNNCSVSIGNAEVIGDSTDTQIKAIIPYDLLEKEGLVADVWVENRVDTKTESSGKKQIKITEGEPLVTTAIRLKKSGMSTSEIAEYLHHQGEQVIDDHYIDQKGLSNDYKWFDRDMINKVIRRTFGNIHFTGNGSEVVRLREGGFENDFIEKMTGQPQYVTFGPALVWLGQTKNFVITPMARIFVQPTGYYTPRMPLSILHPLATWDWRRVGINIGYTPSTPTSNTTAYNGTNTETKNYILAGLCYEINRSALLNLGVATATGGAVRGRTQFYAGFTLDQNVLKGLGLMKD